MKKLLILLLIITSCNTTSMGQKEILGSWTGELSISGTKLRLGFNIKEVDGALTATMDSPDQNAFGLPCSKVRFENKTLIIEAENLNVKYKASLEAENKLSGTFYQNGMELPLDLKRVDEKAEADNSKPLAEDQKVVLGNWAGALDMSGMKLRLGFNIKDKDGALVTTMDSPDQNAFDIPCTNTNFEDGTLVIELSNLNIKYTATLEGEDKLLGTFFQNGMEFPMHLERTDKKAEVKKRPQEPKEPFGYEMEKVKFKNAEADVELAGTLSYPKEGEAHAVAILISGSGPQNRDCFLLGHKPFLVIADFLTKQGIAVLRYDDRGVGASTGNFSAATSEDFGSDVQAAIDFLKTHDKIDPKKIGLIGHSEGGLIAPMVAAGNEDVAFVVSMAGPGMAGKDLLPEQMRLISEAGGTEQENIDKEYKKGKKMFSIIAKETTTEKREAAVTKFLKQEEEDLTDEDIKKVLQQYTSPWFVYFMRYNPSADWMKVTCPVLAINGSKDLQVPADDNLAGIEKSLEKGGNKDITIEKIEDQNHLFQTCTTGHPAEYSVIDETFSPKTLELISVWINKRF